MKSIRRQLVLSLVLGLSVLFAGASSALYFFVRDALKTQFDQGLATKILSFTRMAEEEVVGGRVRFELEFADFPLPEFRPSPDAEFFQVLAADGAVVVRSASLEGRDLPEVAAGEGRPLIADVDLPDGRRGRAGAVWFSPAGAAEREDLPPPERLCLVMARSREGLDRALGGLLVGFGSMWVLLILGLIAAVRWSVGRGLEPLERIAEGAAGVAAHNLSHRFTVEGLPREVAPIAIRLNELLRRIEAAFERERRFSADVAHELRTPLAELRALAEVALRAPPAGAVPVEAARGAFTDVLDIARQMERIVTVLLALVRCETGHQAVQREAVDLAELVKHAAALHEPEARAKNLSLELNAGGGAVVESDRPLLASILGNLFSNAVTHSPGGGSIACDVARRNGGVIVRLTNTNNALAQEDLLHIFEPFWRKDAARQDGSRNGLGLSLVAAYARLLGIQVAGSLPRCDLFEISLLFPPAQPLETHGAGRA